jgi:Protein of unknown function (DUF3099)
MHRTSRESSSGDESVRITSAQTSHSERVRGRQTRYLISMGIRTLCFVAAILVGDGWLRWVLIVAAVILPYIAVVMANAVSSKSDGFALLDGASGYRELPPTSESEGPTGRPGI